MRALIDTCIVIDALQNRQPFHNAAQELFLAVANRRFDGFLTAKSITDIYYLTTGPRTVMQKPDASLQHCSSSLTYETQEGSIAAGPCPQILRTMRMPSWSSPQSGRKWIAS